jgi:hypothetical protein
MAQISQIEDRGRGGEKIRRAREQIKIKSKIKIKIRRERKAS